MESALQRSYTGGVVWGWDQEMAATNVELIHTMIRVLVSAYGGKKAKKMDPLTLPRPWSVDADGAAVGGQKRNATVKEALATVGAALGMKRRR